MAIGQDKLNVTPLQMAMVASAVANGGKLMEPHLTDRIVDRDGRTVDKIQPREMSAGHVGEAAGEVADMMGKVVEEGTGTAAALEGIDGRRQDRHGRGRPPVRPQPGLVHRVRAAPQPEGRDRGDRRVLERARAATRPRRSPRDVMQELLK